MYFYEGLTKSGEKVEGRFLGSKEELVRYLQKEGIILLSLKKESLKSGKAKFNIFSVYESLDRLVYLLSSGLLLNEAVKLLVETSSNDKLSQFWELVLNHMKEGKQFSLALKEALDFYKLEMPQFYLSVISIGEEVGNLTFSLKVVASDIEFRNKLKREIKTAVSYPIFLIVMSLITVLVVSVFILPKFSQIFTPKEIAKLPAVSRFTIEFGVFIKSHLVTVFVSFLIFVLSVIYLSTLPMFRDFLKKVLSRMPFIGDAILKLELSNLFSSLAIMLKGGVKLDRAFSFAGKVVTDERLKNVVNDTREELKKGRRIMEIWSKYSIIPAEVVALVAVGENSGNLELIFDKLSKKYMEDFKDRVSSLLTFLEPAIIVVVGVFIAFIVVGILLAVLSTSDVF